MDTQQLIDQVTRIVMERLNGGTSGAACGGGSSGTPSVVTFGEVPACLLGSGVSVRAGYGPSDVDGAEYIVLTQAAFRALHGGVVPAALGGANLGSRLSLSKPHPGDNAGFDNAAPARPASSPVAASCTTCGNALDLTGHRLIGERDVRALALTTGATVRVDPQALVTALARDYVHSQGATIIR